MAPSTSTDHLRSDSWTDSRKHATGSRDFLVSVELWVLKPSGAFRKTPLPRRTSERREAPAVSTSLDDKKIKEKPSWFRGYGTISSATGQWQPATCKLTQEGDRCILNIYVNETRLLHSIYIHLLRCTDIRLADKSLFYRNDCLGIHTKAGQRWLDVDNDEVVYTQFSNSDAVNTWLALLRSYASPEIYGRRHAPTDGGLYRMWRQVNLHVVQGRGLGIHKTQPNFHIPGSSGDFDNSEEVEMDIFCEVFFNENICGRTTVKKAIGAPEWHEQFSFGDLPPFGDLSVQVYREKKVAKPQLIGSIHVTLGTFRRGEIVDGWFPVLSVGTHTAGAGLQLGEIRLKVKVEEEIILPNSAYNGILDTMSQRNTLDLLSDLEQGMKIANISHHIIAIAVARNVLSRDIAELADREVDGGPNSHHTLFRGNTVLTKTMELAMAWYGKAFLEGSVGPVVRRLCAEKVSIEVDPIKSGKGVKDLEKNVDLLVYWCHEFWNQIYAVRGDCPNELRKLFQHIRLLVEARYEGRVDSRDLKWQSVSAFCFLRFIVPAILHPHLFGLCPGLPSPPVKRSLILIAKVMQSLANLNPAVQKEEFMRGIKNFMVQSIPAMIDYIIVVSTPIPERYGHYPPAGTDTHDRIHFMNSLRERGHSMPTLHREAIPLLPHLLDVPKHLAIITSAVVRNYKSCRSSNSSVEQSERHASLEEFTQKCFEVEDVALQAVNKLASRLQHTRSNLPSISTLSGSSANTASRGPRYSQILGLRLPAVSSPHPSCRGSRPSTAPSYSDYNSDHASDLNLPSPTRTVTITKLAVRSIDVSSSGAGSTSNVWPERSSLTDYDTASMAADNSLHRTQSQVVGRIRATPSLTALDTSVDSGETGKSKGFFRGIFPRR